MLCLRKMYPVLFITFLSACGNLSKVSKDGTTDNPIWPKIDKSSFNHNGTQYGSWPEKDAVRLIAAGMNKDQIYNLIGRPHFSEGFVNVREWDYVFNYRENGEHKICQFKILFDENMDARSFFWLPDKCGLRMDNYINENINTTTTAVSEQKTTKELPGDVLFGFDSAKLTPEGEEIISGIIKKIEHLNRRSISIEGYTDPLGSEVYNRHLSLKRAESVKKAFINMGVPASVIQVKGLGASAQVKKCDADVDSKLRECLKLNRRVIINISG